MILPGYNQYAIYNPAILIGYVFIVKDISHSKI